MRPAAALAAAIVVAACGGDAPTYLDRAAMLDPETCVDCHPDHVEEWRSSMHAYAGDDPVFVAMNARGQRETDGALGDFCVKCHAPMAVRDGLTTDGLNLAELPAAYRGVTCFFCHTAEQVEGDHNNPVVLGEDLVMRGGFGDPTENDAHAARYSNLLDGNHDRSSELCGSCHDIVTPAGVHLERTYAEFKDSLLANLVLDDGTPATLTCRDCHMKLEPDAVVADVDGVPLRGRRLHTFPGVDTAITTWPGMDLQQAGIDNLLAPFVRTRVCHNPIGNQIDVRLTSDAAHMFPSGATQDRRAWVELRAYAGEELIYSSGVVPEGGSIVDLVGVDPDLWLMRDRVVDADGDETHMFWEAAAFDPAAGSQLLPPAVEKGADHSRVWPYPLGAAPTPDRIEVAVKIQAIGRDVLDDLIASGDLAASYRDAFPTHTLADASITWTTEAAGTDRCVD